MTAVIDEPELFSDVFRRKMVSFARMHLDDAELAEDAVQEALLIAFRDQEKFQGKSSPKTWVFGILKNTLRDALRQKYKNGLTVSITSPDSTDDDSLNYFDKQGHWLEESKPNPWQTPEQLQQNEEFMVILEACMLNLPESQCRIFTMREILELESNEICQVADITEKNFYVLLYRARIKLRSCLENHWYEGECPTC